MMSRKIEFVNSGLILWERKREEWLSGKCSSKSGKSAKKKSSPTEVKYVNDHKLLYQFLIFM